MLDFTGELNRWAIMRATARDKAAVQGARDLVDALMGRFLEVGGGCAGGSFTCQHHSCTMPAPASPPPSLAAACPYIGRQQLLCAPECHVCVCPVEHLAQQSAGVDIAGATYAVCGGRGGRASHNGLQSPCLWLW